MRRTEELIAAETAAVTTDIQKFRKELLGKKAAIYVGGGFKAISLIKQFREIGIDVVMIGTQTGRQEEYDTINDLVDDGTVILDDANPSELEKFMVEKGAHLLVGGVKERPLAYKLGMAFIDHNHDRKHPLSGYAGAVNFARGSLFHSLLTSLEIYWRHGRFIWQKRRQPIAMSMKTRVICACPWGAFCPLKG